MKVDLNVIQQKVLKQLIQSRFREVTCHIRDKGLEMEFICPWCSGGASNRVTFHFNLSKGAGHCFRASCGYEASAVKFIMDLAGVDYNAAKLILQGDCDPGDFTKATLSAYKKAIDREYDELNLSSFVSADILDLVPVNSSEHRHEVIDWLTDQRKYDAEWFLNRFQVLVPLDEYRYGYVAIKVLTGDSEAYQLYTYNESTPKTINPPNSILSRMLFNWNNVCDNDGVCFLHEGIFDTARVDSWGFNAVSTFGTIIHPEQIAYLVNSDFDEYCFCYDFGADDRAKAAVKKLSRYTSKKVSYCVPENELDPDDQHEDQYLRQYVNRRVFNRSSSRQKLMDKIRSSYGY